MAGTFSDLIDAIRTKDYGEGVRQPIADALEWLKNNFVNEDGLQVGGRVTDADKSAITSGSSVSFDNAQSNRLLDLAVETYSEVSERPFDAPLQGLLMTIASNGNAAALARKHQLFFVRRKAHIYWRFTGLNPEDTTQYVWSDWRELATMDDIDALRTEFGSDINTLLRNIALKIGGGIINTDLSAITVDGFADFNNAEIRTVLDVFVDDASVLESIRHRPFPTGNLHGLLMTLCSGGNEARNNRIHQLFLAREKKRIYWRYKTSITVDQATTWAWSEWQSLVTTGDIDKSEEKLRLSIAVPGTPSVSATEPFTILSTDRGLVTPPFRGPGEEWTLIIAPGFKVRVYRLTKDFKLGSAAWYTPGTYTITNSTYVAFLMRTYTDGDETADGDTPDSLWDHVALSFTPTVSDAYIGLVNNRIEQYSAPRTIFTPRPTLSAGSYSVSIGSIPTYTPADNRLCLKEPLAGPGAGWDLTIEEGYAVRVIRMNAQGEAVTASDPVTGAAYSVAGTTHYQNASFIQLIFRTDPDSELAPDINAVWDHVRVSFLDEQLQEAQLAGKNAQRISDMEAELEKKQDAAVRYENDTDYCGWSYWMYPQATRISLPRNDVYFGCVTMDGLSGVGCVNGNDLSKRSKTTLFPTNHDTHNGSAVFLNPDTNRLMVFATTHNEDRYIRMAIGKETRQGRFFNTPVKIPFSDKVTYAQIHKDHTHNRLALFTRLNTFRWAVKFSVNATGDAKDNTGETWEDTEAVIVDARTDSVGNEQNLQYYCLFRETNREDFLRIVMYSNPNPVRNTDTTIRMGFLDLTTGYIYDRDATNILGSLTSGGIKYDQFDAVVVPATGKKNRLFDVVSGTAPDEVYIAYSDFDDGTVADHPAGGNQTYHVYYNGTIVDVCEAGLPVYAPSYVPGGILFHTQDKDRVFVSVCPSGAACSLDEYAYNGGSYAKVKTLTTSGSTNPRMRVFNPIMDAEGTMLLFNRGYMLDNTYMYYNIDVDALDPDAT